MPAANTDLLKKYLSLFSTTLSTSIGTGTSDTITPASVSGLPTDTAITITIDRVDSGGVATPTKMERIRGIISGGNLIDYVRGVDGTTEQAHTAGAVIEMVWNADDWNDMVDWGLEEHNQDGTHKPALVTTLKASGAEVTTGTEDAKIVTPKSIADAVLTLTTPKIVTSINDANGNEVIKTPATASAVNEVTITNSATGNAVQLSATGGDTDIDLALQAKGTGAYVLKGTSDTAAELRLSEDTDNGTNYVGLKAPASTANLTFTLPSADGTSGQALVTNASGVLSFATVVLSSKLIVSTRDMTAASGNVAYTGVGFVPTSIHAIMYQDGAVSSSKGFSDSDGVSRLQLIAANGTVHGRVGLVELEVTTGNSQVATVASYDADGFTLTWTKTGTPTGTGAVMFLCYR